MVVAIIFSPTVCIQYLIENFDNHTNNAHRPFIPIIIRMYDSLMLLFKFLDRGWFTIE